MASHNPNRPSFKESTSDEYKALFRRVEAQFEPSEMNREALISWLNNSTLADLFATTKEVNDQIEDLNTIEELRELKDDAKRLNIHSEKVLIRIEEKINAIGITTTEEFAEEREIILTEEIKGNLETWKDGKQRLVIREQGRLKAWRIV